MRRLVLTLFILIAVVTPAQADAIKGKKKVSLANYRLANNAEIVGLYGFVDGSILNAFQDASAKRWSKLDLNLDTKQAVNDPNLKIRRTPCHVVNVPIVVAMWEAEIT